MSFSFWRSFLFIIGVLLAIPLLVLLAMAFTLQVSPSGIGYLFGVLLAVVGLVIAPRMPRYYIPLAAGILVVVFVAITRLVSTNVNLIPNLKVITLPNGKETAWLNALVDEQA